MFCVINLTYLFLMNGNCMKIDPLMEIYEISDDSDDDETLCLNTNKPIVQGKLFSKTEMIVLNTKAGTCSKFINEINNKNDPLNLEVINLDDDDDDFNVDTIESLMTVSKVEIINSKSDLLNQSHKKCKENNLLPISNCSKSKKRVALKSTSTRDVVNNLVNTRGNVVMPKRPNLEEITIKLNPELNDDDSLFTVTKVETINNKIGIEMEINDDIIIRNERKYKIQCRHCGKLFKYRENVKKHICQPKRKGRKKVVKW